MYVHIQLFYRYFISLDCLFLMHVLFIMSFKKFSGLLAYNYPSSMRGLAIYAHMGTTCTIASFH